MLLVGQRADLEAKLQESLAKLEQTSWKALQKALKQYKPRVSQNTWDTRLVFPGLD